MLKKSAFYRNALPPALEAIGVKRAPVLDGLARQQIKALEAAQELEARNLQARVERIGIALREARKTAEQVSRASKLDLDALLKIARRTVGEARLKVAEVKKGERPTRIAPEHNPTRYPPYDYWWYSYSWWGVSPTHTFQPRTSDGRLRINGSSLEPAGGVVGSCGVAMWYYAATGGTLAITAQTRLYGACEALAWSIPWPMGYVYNHSSLRVGAWTQGKFNSDTRDYYNRSGVSVYDFYTGFNGTVHTLTHYIPVAAGNWYLLWAIHDTSQTADGIASTATNVDMYVNDFIYNMV